MFAALLLATASCGNSDNNAKTPKPKPPATKPAAPAQPTPMMKGSGSFTDADYKRRTAELRKLIAAKAPGSTFNFVVQKPFIVIGDEAPARVEQRAISTVKWAVDRLKSAYFAKDPKHILSVWLFKDKASYRKHTKALFDDDPGTPYGYYSSAERALIMNIATGGGTLVHEIVHPFIEANFEDCPSWFNEGLGSLYEQSSSRAGKIVGLTNWRLAGLQRAIRKNEVPSFKTLTSTTSRQFYNQDPGTNYSQSRYLLYYLQEKGLLRSYYKQFVANVKTDPTGYATLQKVLGRKDMAAFKLDWQRYVLKLRFGG